MTKNSTLYAAIQAERKSRAKQENEIERRREANRKELERLIREEPERRRARRLSAAG